MASDAHRGVVASHVRVGQDALEMIMNMRSNTEIRRMYLSRRAICLPYISTHASGDDEPRACALLGALLSPRLNP